MKSAKKAFFLTLPILLIIAGCSKSAPVTVHEINDIKGKLIGYLENTIGEVYVNKIGTGKAYSSPEVLAADLAAGSVDCAIADRRDADKIVAASRNLRLIPDPAVKLDMRIAINAVYPDMRDAFNTAIAALKSNGTLAALRGAYFEGKPSPRQPVLPDGPGLILAIPDKPKPPYITFGTDPDTGQFKPGGLAIDTAGYICETLGMSLTIERVSESRIMNTLRLGRAEKSYFAMCWEFFDSAEDASAIYSTIYDSFELSVVTRKG